MSGQSLRTTDAQASQVQYPSSDPRMATILEAVSSTECLPATRLQDYSGVSSNSTHHAKGSVLPADVNLLHSHSITANPPQRPCNTPTIAEASTALLQTRVSTSNAHRAPEGRPIPGNRYKNKIYITQQTSQSSIDQFELVKATIKKLVDEYMPNDAARISYELSMVGTRYDNTSPSVLLITTKDIAARLKPHITCSPKLGELAGCEEGRLFTRVSRLLGKSPSKPLRLDFYLLESLPVHYRASHSLESKPNSVHAMCGALLSYGDRVSTLGLLLTIDKSLCGMTVKHLFETADIQGPLRGDDNSMTLQEHASERIDPTVRQRSADSRPNATETQHEDEQSKLRPMEESASSGGLVQALWLFDEDEYDLMSVSENSLSAVQDGWEPTVASRPKQDHQPILPAKRLVCPRQLAPDAANLDWALVQLEAANVPDVSNRVGKIGSDTSIRTHSYASSPRYHLVPVSIATGRSGLLTGRLSQSSLFLGSASGTALPEVWSVNLDIQQDLQFGDSGAVVFDTETHDIYGYVMGVDWFGRVSIVPFKDALVQIKASFDTEDVMISTETTIALSHHEADLPMNPAKGSTIMQSIGGPGASRLDIGNSAVTPIFMPIATSGREYTSYSSRSSAGSTSPTTAALRVAMTEPTDYSGASALSTVAGRSTNYSGSIGYATSITTYGPDQITFDPSKHLKSRQVTNLLTMSHFDYDLCRLPDPLQNMRLFELFDKADQINGFITGALRIAPAADTEYACLSYDAASPANSTAKRLLLRQDDGKDYFLYIPEGLDSALRGLQANRACRTKSLWIDFICINQDQRDSRREMDGQTALLSSIYRKAKIVYIWLGNHADKSELVFDFLRQEVLDLSKFKDLGNEKYFERWVALSKVLKRSCFNRRWILQEIALARHALVLCGDDCITWDDFADGVTLFEAQEKEGIISMIKRGDKSRHRVPDYYDEIEALGAVQLSRLTHNLFTEPGEQNRSARLSLEHLVSICTPFIADNPRDTFYAILSLAKDTCPRVETLDTEVDDPSPPGKGAALGMLSAEVRKRIEALGRKLGRQPFRVDYKQTISQVYVDGVKFMIKAARTTHPASALDIICRPWAPQPDIRNHRDSDLHQRATYAGPGPEQWPDFVKTDVVRNSLPSWIQNVKGESHGIDKRNNTMYRKNADTLVGLPPTPHYSASGRRQIVKDYRFESFTTEHSHNPELIGIPYHSMFVEGFVLDEVGPHLGDRAVKGMIPPDWSDVSQCSEDGQPPDKWQAYWRTLVADRDPNGQNPARIYPRMTLYALNQGLEGEPKDLRSIELYDTCREVSEFVKRVQAVIWKKRLARSRDLDRLMLLPERARQGDLICILYGCSVPVVLRRFEKKPEEILSEERQRQRKAVGVVQNALRNRWQSLARGIKRKFAGTSAGPSKLSTAQMQTAVAIESSDSFGSPVPPHTVEIAAQSLNSPEAHSHAMEPPPIPRHGLTSNIQTTSLHALDSPSIQMTEHLFPPDPPSRPTARTRAMSYASSDTAEETTRLEIRQDKTDFYEFVGECYVHGMMTGEALAEQRKRDLRVQIFELR